MTLPAVPTSVLSPQFPMYWFGLPAIMKGWIDRVLTSGFAFSQEKRYSQGIFKVRSQSRSLKQSNQICLCMLNFFPPCRTRKPCCLLPLGLLNPCSAQLALMET